MTRICTSLVLAAVIAGSAGCGDEGSAPSSNEDKAPSSTTAPLAASCPDPHGGSCLGELKPGTFRTKIFRPGIEYTVPDGWVNGEDLPGNFLLTRRVDPQPPTGGNFVGIYRDIRASALDCSEAPQPGVGASVDELTAWMSSRDGLEVTQPVRVSVGGLTGVMLDVGLDPGWTGTCPFSEGTPVVPLIIGSGVSQLAHSVAPGMKERLYLLSYRTGTVTIEIGHVPGQGTFEEYVEAARPIIESLKFTDAP